MFLSNLGYGQGFVVIENIDLDSQIRSSETIEIEPIVCNSDLTLNVIEGNLIKTIQVKNKVCQELANGSTFDKSNSLVNKNYIYGFQNKKLVKWKVSKSQYKTIKRKYLPKQLRNRDLVLYDVFGDKDYLYYVFQYNNFNAKNGHDLVYIIKYSYNFRIMKWAEVDIGNDILMGVFDVQNIDFNEKGFVIAKPLQNEFVFLDKELKLYKSMILDSQVYSQNRFYLDTLLNQKITEKFFHHPSDFADYWVNNFNNSHTINKVILTKSNTNYLVVSTILNYREKYKIDVWDLTTSKLISSDTMYYGAGDFKYFAYTNRMYLNDYNSMAVPRVTFNSDTTLNRYIQIWKFIDGSKANRTDLNSYPIFNLNGDLPNLNSFSTCMIADYLYCHNCKKEDDFKFPNAKTLVILSTEKNEPAVKIKIRAQYFLKAHPELKEVYFLEEEKFNELNMRKLALNKIYILE